MKLPTFPKINFRWKRQNTQVGEVEIDAVPKLDVRPSKQTRRKKILVWLIRGILGVFIVGVFLAVLAGFVFLRYRQHCNYQSLVDQGLVVGVDQHLCLNFLDKSNWDDIVKQAFSFTLISQLEVVAADGTVSLSAAETCGDQLNPICWLKGTKPELKQKGGFTNFLLVGLDTREGTQLKNTDTIMVASLDHTSGEILFISFPRDLYIYYKKPSGYNASWKINGIYAIDGVKGLKYAIEQIIGKPIHYHAFIKFDTFINVIDKLGGVDIVLKEPFADLYPCPEVPKGKSCPSNNIKKNYGYYTFKKGKNHFDSFDALVYARSRQLSSDYDRASRQQLLIKAVIDNALKSKLPLQEQLNLYLEIYNLVSKNVITNVKVEDVAAMMALMDRLNNNPARVVVDPTLNGGRLITHLGIKPAVGWSIGFRDETFGQFQNFIKRIWDNLPYYVEKPRVLIKYSSENQKAAKKLANSNNPFWKVKLQKLGEDLTGNRLYSISSKSVVGSLQDLQSEVSGALIYNAKIEGIKQTSWKEDILIVLASE